MPTVTIQVTRGGDDARSGFGLRRGEGGPHQGVSGLLLNVLKKPLESTFVIIEEVDADNWDWGGMLALEYRHQRATVNSDADRSEVNDMAREVG